MSRLVVVDALLLGKMPLEVEVGVGRALKLSSVEMGVDFEDLMLALVQDLGIPSSCERVGGRATLLPDGLSEVKEEHLPDHADGKQDCGSEIPIDDAKDHNPGVSSEVALAKAVLGCVVGCLDGERSSVRVEMWNGDCSSSKSAFAECSDLTCKGVSSSQQHGLEVVGNPSTSSDGEKRGSNSETVKEVPVDSNEVATEIGSGSAGMRADPKCEDFSHLESGGSAVEPRRDGSGKDAPRIFPSDRGDFWGGAIEAAGEDSLAGVLVEGIGLSSRVPGGGGALRGDETIKATGKERNARSETGFVQRNDLGDRVVEILGARLSPRGYTQAWISKAFPPVGVETLKVAVARQEASKGEVFRDALPSVVAAGINPESREVVRAGDRTEELFSRSKIEAICFKTNVTDGAAGISGHSSNLRQEAHPDHVKGIGTIIKEMVERVEAHSSLKERTVIVHLKPDFLGKVRIQVSMDNRDIRVAMWTDNPTARGLIESSLGALREFLSGQGLNVVNFSFHSFGGDRDRRDGFTRERKVKSVSSVDVEDRIIDMDWRTAGELQGKLNIRI